MENENTGSIVMLSGTTIMTVYGQEIDLSTVTYDVQIKDGIVILTGTTEQ